MHFVDDLLIKNAVEQPEKVALVHRGRRVVHRELIAHAHRVAHALLHLHGLGGNRIALLLRNCPEFLFCYFGATLSRNVAVPLNYTLPADDLPYLLNNSQSSCLITSAEFLPKLSGIGRKTTALRTVITIDEADGAAGLSTGLRHLSWKGFLAGSPAAVPSRSGATPDDVVVFLYTSGTTGSPKAAMCTHRSLLSNVATEAVLYGLGPSDVFACVLPMFHNYSLVDTCLLPLWYGATIVIAEPDETEQLLQTIEEERITFLATMPAQLSEMAFLPFSRTYDTSSLRMVQTGGALLATEVQKRFQERYHLPIIEGYGCSEASSTVTVIPMQGPYKALSVGKVMPNQRIRIVDPDDRDVPPGELGEVAVQGPNVSLGYYGLPDETAITFRHGWLHTGDLGRIDEDGFLFIVGRVESAIEVDGLKVYPSEVENVLRQIDGVIEACAVGTMDGGAKRAFRAFLEVRDDYKLEESAVLAHCQRVLAPHKVPKRVELRSRLPRTGTGKISRRALEEEA